MSYFVHFVSMVINQEIVLSAQILFAWYASQKTGFRAVSLTHSALDHIKMWSDTIILDSQII